MVRRHGQARNGALHGKMRSTQDIEPVDLFDAGFGDGDLCDFQKLFIKGFPAPGCQPFGIIQPIGNAGRIENHCGGRYGPGKWSAPNLVNTCNAGQPSGDGVKLK